MKEIDLTEDAHAIVAFFKSFATACEDLTRHRLG